MSVMAPCYQEIALKRCQTASCLCQAIHNLAALKGRRHQTAGGARQYRRGQHPASANSSGETSVVSAHISRALQRPEYPRRSGNRQAGLIRLLHGVQGQVLSGTIRALQYLGPARCSDFGAMLARTVGPVLSVSRIALDNLRIAFPEMAESSRNALMRDAWDNLGRVVAEFPHLPNLGRTQDGPGWEIVGEECIAQAWQGGNPPLFFSAHLGNWEMILPIAGALGLPVGGVYRRTSNPAIDRLIQGIRERAGSGTKMFPKGRQGAKAIIAHLSAGGTVGFLVDQKMNDGIKIPFFGSPAWTAPAIAHLALRFERNIVPVSIVRIGPARFRLVCEPALRIALSGNQKEDEVSIMSAINRHLEGWISSRPSAWLWFHRRWPKGASADQGRHGAVHHGTARPSRSR